MRAVAVPMILVAGLAPRALAQGTDADEARAHRAEIAADASARASLLTSSADAGGPAWRQNDASVRLGGMMQFRYTANARDGEGMEESFTHGFSLPRARLWVNADLNETWSVYVQTNFDPDGGELILLDAWADWKLDDHWTLRAGQFKVPSFRTWNTPDQNILAADRSVTDLVFNEGRTQGVAAIYTADDFRVVGALDDGAGAANTEFNGAAEADYAITGRADWKFAGEWSRLNGFHGWRGSENAGLVGGFLHFQDGGGTGVGSVGSTADASLFEALVDGQWQGNGWSAYAAFVYRLIDAAGGDSMNDLGLIAQGAYFVSDADELFARYDVVVPDGDTPGGDEPFNTLTFGWNHFFIPESEASRFTLDLQWFLNESTENGLVGSIPSIGLLDSGEKNQVALRAQYQATF